MRSIPYLATKISGKIEYSQIRHCCCLLYLNRSSELTFNYLESVEFMPIIF